MRILFEKLGLNSKEIEVYIYLLEYGISAASEIAKSIGLPKSSINFLADNLWKSGMITKSFRGKTGYYEADAGLLEKTILTEVGEKEKALEELLPILREKNKNIISKPKISFIDGVDQCKKEYLELLKYNIFYEFGAHDDLASAFGEEFMNNFIAERIKKNVFCDSIATDGVTENNLQELDVIQNRTLKIFPQDIFGRISSSIIIYSNKVLILNLRGINTGVLIENEEFAQTMKTIFLIGKRKI